MTAQTPMPHRRQGRIGLALASAIVGAWAAAHVWGVFFQPLGGPGGAIAAALLVPLICWLNVGLFIIAHDAMHGSLVPRAPAANRWAGRIALALYAGFSFDRLLPKHHDHHKYAGTARDPDYHDAPDHRFWPWYATFFRRYFGLRELAILSALSAFYLYVLGAPLANLLLFWALPAILSSFQLFLFGTYLPHRRGDADFADRHRARSNDYAPLASLLTCFHFGYHHEHHLAPHLPWWRLPAERSRRRAGALSPASLPADRPRG
jgi:beta-carotene/zeaxanthin 4-ketolase